MKKTVFISISCILCLFLVFSFCACSGSDEIVGEWEIHGNYTGTSTKDLSCITFNSDGTITGIKDKDTQKTEVWHWSYDKSAKRYNIENDLPTIWHAYIIETKAGDVQLQLAYQHADQTNEYLIPFAKKA